MDLIRAAIGVDSSWQITVTDSLDNPITTFTTNDLPSAQVWYGDDQSVLFAPTATWISPAAGTIKLTVGATQTAGTIPAKYRVRVMLATQDGRNLDVYEGLLQLTYAPGADPALTPYCTYDDLLNYAPWIEKEQSLHSQAGFIEDRYLARTWLETLIQRHYRLSGFTGIITFGRIMSIYPGVARNGYNKWLQDQLNAGYLMLRPEIVEISAKRAISTICQSLVGPASTADSPYQRLANRYSFEANALAKCSSAQLDLNGDLYPEIIVPLGCSSMRW